MTFEAGLGRDEERFIGEVGDFFVGDAEIEVVEEIVSPASKRLDARSAHRMTRRA